MKGTRKKVLAAILIGMVMPNILINGVGLLRQTDPILEMTTPSLEEQNTEHDAPVYIRVKQGEDVEEMELEDYLVGVVLGEMPVSFELEALKSQAVVARTYTLRRKEAGTKHENADICTDPSCCQAYRDPGTYSGDEAMLDKLRSAVRDTCGQVLTYQGNLIEATYFSSSGGRTEDAVAVWGSDLPYLQAVESPEEEYEDKYLSSVSFSPETFQEALSRDLSGDCTDWFGNVCYTNGGGVDTMEIGGIKYEGTRLRQLLGLRSTAFSVSVTDDVITITTRGYGHRVGMSQYGAEAMALDGKSYTQILAHYYVGTQLQEFVDIGEQFR